MQAPASPALFPSPSTATEPSAMRKTKSPAATARSIVRRSGPFSKRPRWLPFLSATTEPTSAYTSHFDETNEPTARSSLFNVRAAPRRADADSDHHRSKQGEPDRA